MKRFQFNVVISNLHSGNFESAQGRYSLDERKEFTAKNNVF